jgi:hypothetical protein
MDPGGAAVADETATEEEQRIAAEMGGGDGDEAGADQRKTLAELAGEEPEADPDDEQFLLFGTAPSVNAQVKGVKVGSSHVKFTAKQQQLPGQFNMGDVVELRVLARVDKLEFVSKHDGDGNVTETKRIHRLSALTVEQTGDVDPKFDEVDARGQED